MPALHFVIIIAAYFVGDMSSSENVHQERIDERIQFIFDSENPKIIDDLRHLNRGHSDKYEIFWTECKKYLEDVVQTAVDDRRHGEHTHLAKAISVRDLLEQVRKRCPEGTLCQSKQWLRLQFWPKNPTSKTALQYTGKLDVKFMIQSRQLRVQHDDSHYCAALFRYAKEFATEYREHCTLLFMDDKHRCKVGEPGYPVAAVERGKQVIVNASGKRFSVADHDFTSVILLCDIPNSIEESFYRGQVFVSIKDAIFQPSSPLRHCTELSKLKTQKSLEKPILMMYTDGGPDHNNTFLSVQLSLIAVFLKHDIDMAIAVRTAPHQSWKNPCERVNCILNLGLQAVGLMRARMSESLEKAISSSNSMTSIRDAADRNPGLKDAVADSVEPVKCLLRSVFSRLMLKDKPISSYEDANEDEMQELYTLLEGIDPAITREDRSKKCLSSRPKLKEFVNHCCHEIKYMFAVKKCGKLDCDICKSIRMPIEIFNSLHHLPDPIPADDEHYKSFSSVYGTLKTEKHRPTLLKEIKKAHGIPFSPNAQTARDILLCVECLKPRVVYSKYLLTTAEERDLHQHRARSGSLQLVNYVCTCECTS